MSETLSEADLAEIEARAKAAIRLEPPHDTHAPAWYDALAKFRSVVTPESVLSLLATISSLREEKEGAEERAGQARHDYRTTLIEFWNVLMFLGGRVQIPRSFKSPISPGHEIVVDTTGDVDFVLHRANTKARATLNQQMGGE